MRLLLCVETLLARCVLVRELLCGLHLSVNVLLLVSCGREDEDIPKRYLVCEGMGFTVVVHHGGAFVGDRMLGYEGGEVHAFHNLDVDNWSYFETLGLIKDLGYREAVKLWWNVGKGRKGKMFKSISCDSHALEMCQYAVDNNREVDLFVEHTQVSQLVLLEESTLLTFNNEGEKEKEKVEQGVVGGQKLDDEKVEEGDGGNKSEDSFDGDEEYDGSDSADGSDDLHFSDSEEERNLGMDDGFEETIFSDSEEERNLGMDDGFEETIAE
ncbi:hypothetical protein SESBI_22229 [Sesbania bispinosa]|nr:hypothetical protein SESBI_22229 [Sesbania bispinosa]